jgi:hypothetical protein
MYGGRKEPGMACGQEMKWSDRELFETGRCFGGSSGVSSLGGSRGAFGW